MISYPSAKINIGLNIVEKRADGYHNIESVFYPIPLFDILEINKSSNFSFSCSGLAIAGNVHDNIIVKAYHLLKSKYNIGEVSIHLHKQIPMGAGLGGGSADGAETLNMLNTIFKLNLTNTELEKIALKLGSDCPFFIENTPKYVSGIGDIMETVEIDLKGLHLYLVNPEIHISTKAAYADIIALPSDIKLFSLAQGNKLEWKETIKNDFEKSIFNKYPKLKSLKDSIYAKGAFYASMSGSGSTLYGLFSEEQDFKSEFVFEKHISL